MNDIVSLGCGFYDLETISTSNFRWSSDTFTIYFEKNITDIELFLRCNKVHEEYNLSYSTDNWKIEKSFQLKNGENIIHIDINGAKKINFKSTSFTPSEFTNTTDDRKLGVQIHTVYCKTFDENFYELPINQIRFKRDIDIEKPCCIKESSFYVTLSTGWHELEKNTFRWSNGNGELYLNTNKFDNIKLIMGSSKCSVKIALNDIVGDVSYSFNNNEREVDIKNIKGVKKISITSDIIGVDQKNEILKDDRKLGIRLYSVELYNSEDDEFVHIPIKNIFLNSDKQQLLEFSNFNFSDVEPSEINSDGHIILKKFKSSNVGKINLNNQVVFYTHRSGWSYAIESIKDLHNEDGVKFEGFLERNFFWDKYTNIKIGKIPFKSKWIGVIHNPMTSPFEKEDIMLTSKLLKSIIFMKSLEYCNGLYVLSNDLKDKIKSRVGNIPVEMLYHPTSLTDNAFQWDKFIKNENKQLISIGSWSRKFSSIYLLQTPLHIKKVCISSLTLNEEKLKRFIELEEMANGYKITSEQYNSVNILQYQSSKDYDDLLSMNVAFMDYYDISASNLVIECIVRNTPILIRKHNAAMEYLGPTYPLYFDSLEEAYEKIKDINLIKNAYEYLTTLDIKHKLTGEYFRQSIVSGDIYKNL